MGRQQRALGREPRDFSEFARKVAATGVWMPAREGERGAGGGLRPSEEVELSE